MPALMTRTSSMRLRKPRAANTAVARAAQRMAGAAVVIARALSMIASGDASMHAASYIRARTYIYSYSVPAVSTGWKGVPVREAGF